MKRKIKEKLIMILPLAIVFFILIYSFGVFKFELYQVPTHYYVSSFTCPSTYAGVQLKGCQVLVHCRDCSDASTYCVKIFDKNNNQLRRTSLGVYSTFEDYLYVGDKVFVYRSDCSSSPIKPPEIVVYWDLAPATTTTTTTTIRPTTTTTIYYPATTSLPYYPTTTVIPTSTTTVPGGVNVDLSGEMAMLIGGLVSLIIIILGMKYILA